MMARRAGKALLLVAGLGLLTVLGGCITRPDPDPTPGRLLLRASWQDAQHLNVNVRNVGGSPVPLGGMDSMALTGPDGATPLHWSGMAPTLAPGEGRSFDLHAMHMADGTMGMTMDHAMAGDHMPMPMGEYTLRVGGATAHAMLGGRTP